MTDDRDARLNRALAEKLEPLGSFEWEWPEYNGSPIEVGASPKRLWEACRARLLPGDAWEDIPPPSQRPFHTDADAAVALAEAYGQSFQSVEADFCYMEAHYSEKERAWIAWAAIGTTDGVYSKSFARAVRDAVAAALGVEVEA